MQTASFVEQFHALGFLGITLNTTFSSPQYFSLDGCDFVYHQPGILEVIPLHWSQRVVISSGIHGDETAPIEMVNQLVSELIQGKYQLGARVLFIIAHPQAIQAGKRFIDTNLNRLFEREVDDDGSLEFNIARQLDSVVSNFFFEGEGLKWHLDVHSAIRDSKYFAFAVRPFTEPEIAKQPLMSLLSKGRVSAVLHSQSPSSTFSWYSAHYHQANALTVELGRVARFGENNHQEIKSFKAALVALLNDAPFSLEQGSFKVKQYRVNRVLNKQDDSFRFVFPASTANFTLFDGGEVIAYEHEQPISSQIGERLIFPNANVPIGQRAALLVVEVDN
ncbi:succinylglutamate desuccinylase [Thaumasiovibrio subtropicus]|uniref:succinylglutamate desuccinylase n=1 Tax=Thaumasiovibrio subtropicus TaxID=1891207 RepID=UPI000B35F612|nr:succinylglutamate desuccinylase [Thaumasiovibrio subtropicus]